MKVRNPLKIFFAVVRALFLREMEMKFTVGKSGVFWTFFEPFFQIFIYIGIHALITGSKSTTQSTYNYTVFMASGFIAFNMFRHILSLSTGAFVANKGLFSYKQVKPFDTVVARTLVEVFMTAVIILIFLAIGFFLHIDNLLPKNTLMVTLAFLWLILFSMGIGLLVAIGNVFFISVGKLVGITSFFLLFGSAVFFPVISLPPLLQQMILYNPLVHFMEMIHGYYVEGLDTRFVDYNYMLLWTVIPLFIALWLYERLEKRIIST